MSDRGVPVSEATAADFMMVRAALVARLGGANEALVWSRIHWRVSPDSVVAIVADGERWWSASLETIAGETGLTVKQVRGAIEALVDGGYIDRIQLAGYDRTYSYRSVVAHLPHRADAFALEGRSIRPDGQFHVPSGADVPLIDIEEETSSAAKPKMREVRMPAGWAPNVSHVARAQELGVDVVAEAESFRLHAETHDRHAANWNAAFTTWLKKARPTLASSHADVGREEWMLR